jgi:uncharacterized RDD family membrane protein YckC
VTGDDRNERETGEDPDGRVTQPPHVHPQTPLTVLTALDFEQRSHPIRGESDPGEPTPPLVTVPRTDGAAVDPVLAAARAAVGAEVATPAADPNKADLQLRAIGRVIDVVIFALLAESVSFIGPLVALGYLLLADALFEGTSVGKRLTRLKVVRTRDRKPANVFDSLLRNAPLGIAGLFVLIPLVRWALFLTLGLAILLFEGYLVWTDPKGIRAGDILAGTVVVDSRKKD